MDFLLIQNVSHLSGISPHTLRAWEKRYGLIQPRRSATGRRKYSMADVKKLRLLKSLVDDGLAISQISKLSIEQLRSLISDRGLTLNDYGSKPKAPIFPKSSAQCLAIDQNEDEKNELYEFNLRPLIQNIKEYNLPTLSQQLAQARVSMGARTYVYTVALPIVVRVGHMVQKGQMSISQEHALSAILKIQLAHLVHSIGNWHFDSKSSIVLATPEGDYHEFGIMFAHIIGLLSGVSIHYLGSNMPMTPLAEASQALKATHVIIGTTLLPPEHQRQPITEFASLLYEKIGNESLIYVAGALAPQIEHSSLKDKIGILHTLKAFEKLMKNNKKTLE